MFKNRFLVPKLSAHRALKNIPALFIAVLCCTLGASPAAVTQTLSGAGVKTDLGVYTEGAPPALPAAGGVIQDPVFGTAVMRVTDERDGTHLGTYYSYWPTFNRDSTRLLVRNGGVAFIRDFDPAGFLLGAKQEIPPIPGVGNPAFEGASWSWSDPDTLFVTANASLYAYHPSSRTYELLADIQALMPGEYIKQPSWSRDGTRVAFNRKRYADYSVPGYAVYDRAQGRLLLKQEADLDEVTISQSGRHLLAKLAAQGAGVVESVVHDLDDGTRVQLVDDADAAPGHGDAGADSYVGYDNYGNRMTWRELSAPKQYRVLFQFPAWGLGVGHTSMRAGDEAWALVSFFGTTGAGLFHNEVIQLATDGSGRVRRLLHHRSVFLSYYDSPRANISADGRFVAFTSNWGGQARTDLFVAKIEPATPGPAPSPTPSATPSPAPTPTPTPTPTSGTAAAPGLLTAMAVSSSQINTAWADNSGNESGFKVERCAGTSCADFVEVARVGPNVTSFGDTNLPANAAYLYRVRAFNGGGDSGPSNTAGTTTWGAIAPPAAPADLTASSIGRGTVKLGWADRSNNEQQFSVERSDSASGGFVQIATVGAGVRSYEDKAVSGGRTYYYRVRASNGGGYSAYSNTASARTK